MLTGCVGQVPDQGIGEGGELLGIARGQGDVEVVGGDRPPDPDGAVEVHLPSQPPADDEREELWRRLHEFYAGWSHYQTLTDRELPVVRLRPTSPAP